MSASEEHKRPGLREVVGSVLASFLGVQSNKNRERDFVHGKPSHYIIVGLIAAIVFVLVVVGIVQLVLGLATG